MLIDPLRSPRADQIALQAGTNLGVSGGMLDTDTNCKDLDAGTPTLDSTVCGRARDYTCPSPVHALHMRMPFAWQVCNNNVIMFFGANG